jgi:hypothetical protein
MVDKEDGGAPGAAPKRRWSRRRWLVWGGVSLAASAAGLVGTVRMSGYAPAPPSLRVFGPAHYAVVTAFAERVLVPARCPDAAAFADAYAAELPRKDRRDLLRFVLYLEHIAPMGAGHFRRFTNLAAEARDEVLASLELSDAPLLHAGFRALRDLAYMAHYRSASTWAALGYPGPRIRWETE